MADYVDTERSPHGLAYAHVENQAYRVGRAHVLKVFNQLQIYKPTAFANRESLAHANLEREISSLTG